MARSRQHERGSIRWAAALPLLALASVAVALALGDRREHAGSNPALAGTGPTGGPPSRVIPANAAAAEIVTALIAPTHVAALPTHVADWAELERPELWVDLPRFDRYATEPMLALAPDLVIVDPGQSPATTETLIGLGITVLPLQTPRTWEELTATIESMGQALGAGPAATTLCDRTAQRRAALEARAPEQRLRTLTYSNMGSGGWTAGAGTNLDMIVTWAGLRNAAAEDGIEGHQRLGFESLLRIDPDLIVVAAPRNGGAPPELDVLRKQLASLTCVAAGRIVALPARAYSTTSHRMVDAAEHLAALVEDL